MPMFGAHMSVAGGYFHAVESAHKYGFDTVQLFTKSNNQWKAKPLTELDIQLFRAAGCALSCCPQLLSDQPGQSG